jgi:hypothetical protein
MPLTTQVCHRPHDTKKCMEDNPCFFRAFKPVKFFPGQEPWHAPRTGALP